MTILDEIHKHIQKLPRDKQKKVLDFAKHLAGQVAASSSKAGTLRQHPAFGSWSKRNIDSLNYQKSLRAEWDSRS